MSFKNYMKTEFMSKSQNEAFARVVVAAFVSQLDPTIEQLADIKTAVSEAVTNAIIHGYDSPNEKVYLECSIVGNTIKIVVKDYGNGIADIDLARQPLYTSKPELERSGMGFTVMETFMDEIKVESINGKGTTIEMIKEFKKNKSDKNKAKENKE